MMDSWEFPHAKEEAKNGDDVADGSCMKKIIRSKGFVWVANQHRRFLSRFLDRLWSDSSALQCAVLVACGPLLRTSSSGPLVGGHGIEQVA